LEGEFLLPIDRVVDPGSLKPIERMNWISAL